MEFTVSTLTKQLKNHNNSIIVKSVSFYLLLTYIWNINIKRKPEKK